MLHVFLSISSNFRKWQVKNIAACHWRQARTSLAIQNISIWIIFSTCSRTHSYSSHTVVTGLYSTRARGCNLCSVNDKDNKCNLLYSSVSLHRSSMTEFNISIPNMDLFLTHKQCANLVPRSLVDEAEGEIWPNPICITWSPVRNVTGEASAHAQHKCQGRSRPILLHTTSLRQAYDMT